MENLHILVIFLFHLVLSVQNYKFPKRGDTNKDAVSLPLGSWFNSFEESTRQNSDEIKPADMSEPNDERVHEVVVKRKKIKRKKKRNNKNKWHKSHVNNSTMSENSRRKKPNGRSKKKMAAVTERDFNISESFEGSGRRKPVDIIVHIKMND